MPSFSPPSHSKSKKTNLEKKNKKTVAGTPIYALHHNPAYFPDPFSFKPERWLSTCTPEEEVEAAQSAFTPFSIGPRGCIGKSVAYMELRLTLARLLFEYDCEEIETEGKAARWKEGYAMVDGEYRLMDHFTSRKEGPVMKFSRR